jgi:dimethylamine monooxygenase subunit A
VTSLLDDPRYVPVDGRGFKLAMGLRPLEVSRWIEVGDDAAAQRAEKARLLREHAGDVVAITPDAMGACAELFATLRDHLTEHHGELTTTVDEREHPLVAASRLVAEDLCVLEAGGAGWTLTAAVVCFPSRWRLTDKIGTTVDAIHGPVPGYAPTIGAPTRAFFDRLSVERPVWRLNWTLLDDPALFQPAPGRPAAAADPAALIFRVERQTLRRLVRSGAVVFTIRTYVSRATDLVARHPEFADDVLAALTSAPEDSLAYKGWVGLAPRWADRFCAAARVSPDTSPQ